MSVTRRTVISAAGGLASLATLPVRNADAAQGDKPTIRLRLLETSDLHMFAYDYDYYRGQQDGTVGLTKVSTLLTSARAEARNCMLFDNGDILQGNPLGDYVALKETLPAGRVHPMFRAMNLLRYDAATLGNHEFNYGLPFLDAALSGANFPFACANLKHVGGADYLPPYLVLTRHFTAENGSVHTLRIGVLGLVTPQIMTWDHAHLAGKVEAPDIVDTARRYVPELRAKCDLLVVLSHSGISGAPRRGGDENASLYLADIPGIDVIFTGHEHKVFPGPFFADQGSKVDTIRGTLGGVPAVMPGFWGSHLGVIDLTLESDAGARPWRVASFHVEPRPIYERHGAQVLSLATDDSRILVAVAPDHQATLRWMSEPVGRTEAPITSYFAFVGTEASLSLVNAAQTWYARPLLAQTPHGHLPVLSAAAPFKAGGAGPDSFIDIPAGTLDMKDIANIYMFANTVCAVRCTGAELEEWLEKSVSIFNRIDPGQTAPQELLGSAIPTFNFDVMSGVTYQVDLSQPARFDGNGHLVAPASHRIIALSHDGKPVTPTQQFLVVTNNYRASGGGGFAGTGPDHTVWQAPDYNRDVLTNFIRTQGTVTPPSTPVWNFAPLVRPVTLAFNAAAATERLLPAHPGIRKLGAGQNGYVRYGLTLPA